MDKAEEKGTVRKVFAWLLAVFCAGVMILQAGFVTVGKKYSLEYIFDKAYFLANALILVTAFLAIILFMAPGKKRIAALSVPFTLLLAANFIFMGTASFPKVSAVSLSPDFRHLMILKQQPDSGKTRVYRRVMVLFARPGDPLPYTADGPVKTQWLTADACAVTYREPDGKVHQYVGTFGDRGSGISYYSVETALQGEWSLEGKNTVGKFITVDQAGVTLRGNGTQEHYAHSDCVQSGTLALILCKNGLPQWTIVLNEDGRIENSGLISRGGTLTLCQVSMDKAAPMKYVCISKP